jgi:hypothetical protein
MEENNKIDFETEDIKIAYKHLFDRYRSLNHLIDIYPKAIKDDDVKEKLVVTDLFIEKDIHVLEKRANSLQKQAVALYWLVIIVFCIAAGIAIYRMLFSDHTPLVQKDHTALWIDFTIGTIKGFTAYGLLVLIGVTAWKQSKAKYDQAERLYAKRRQNRQLRLYIHLSDGQIKYEEFLKFLKFAQNENNAFEQIKADAKAPLGNLINDLLKTQSDIIKVLSPKEKK